MTDHENIIRDLGDVEYLERNGVKVAKFVVTGLRMEQYNYLRTRYEIGLTSADESEGFKHES